MTMSALWENDRDYFLVQWPDRDENAEHHFTAAVFNKRERSEHSTSKELMLKLE